MRIVDPLGRIGDRVGDEVAQRVVELRRIGAHVSAPGAIVDRDPLSAAGERLRLQVGDDRLDRGCAYRRR